MNDDAAPFQLLIIDASPLRRACMAVALEAEKLNVVSRPELDGDVADLLARPPDAILLQSGDSTGEAAALPAQVERAAHLWPMAPTLVIADHGDDELMLAALGAGAQAVLPSTISVARIHHALSLLRAGMAVYPAALAQLARRRSQAAGLPADEHLRERVRLAVDQLTPLTRRQRDVLRLLALGASNKDIASSLQISESTVKVHVRAIMALKGASNRTQIVAHLLKGDPASEPQLP